MKPKRLISQGTSPMPAWLSSPVILSKVIYCLKWAGAICLLMAASIGVLLLVLTRSFETQQTAKDTVNRKRLEARIAAIEQKQEKELKARYPIGYKIIGVTHNSIIQGTQTGDFKLSVDWGQLSVSEMEPGKLSILQPAIILDAGTFYIKSDQNFYFIPKRVGFRIELAVWANHVLYLQVIAIENDLIVLALGVLRTEPRKSN
ncbi:MAG: hypothetical protein ABSF52_11335 [Syntrophobacteraceae bacterium]|jgi:hypothetical protein